MGGWITYESYPRVVHAKVQHQIDWVNENIYQRYQRTGTINAPFICPVPTLDPNCVDTPGWTDIDGDG